MRARFRHDNALVVCPLDATCWILHEPFEFRCELGGRERAFTAPPDFVTDFASIPWGLRLIAPRWGSYGWAPLSTISSIGNKASSGTTPTKCSSRL